MNLTNERPITNLIEPARSRGRQVSAVIVIAVVVIGLFVSIFTQPFDNLQGNETKPIQEHSNPESLTETNQSFDKAPETQNNVTKILLWVGQIIISFIATLGSIAELAGINVRELFVSRSAKTSVEVFPFFVIQDFDRLLDYMFPDPKQPMLADSAIKYLPQISEQTDEGFQKSGQLLIRGRSKTGKTREACELLRRWWYTGPTILIARSHVGLYPPFKIPENLPTRNLVLFFDDLDLYFRDSDATKRFDETIQFFQDLCHNKGELRIIATVRQEDEFWHKLGFDKKLTPWGNFELIQLEPLSAEKSKLVIHELSAMSGITIESELVDLLAEKNDGTYLNLALAFRGWLNQKITTVTAHDVKKIEGALLNTWRRRYEQLAKIARENRPIYATVDFMQTRGIPLDPSIIKEIATELYLNKMLLSFIGLFDHIKNWIVVTRFLNWYRDPVTRRKNLAVLLSCGLLILYLVMYILLCLIPGNTQTWLFDQITSNSTFLFILLTPLLGLLLFFAFYSSFSLLHFLAARKIRKAFDLLLETEIPFRNNYLRPYEGQFEGCGATNNWPVGNYDGSTNDPVFQRLITPRLTNLYLNLAEKFRLVGELPTSRNLVQLATIFSPNSPVPPFLLGKIELEEKNYHKAALLFSASQNFYRTSSTLAYAAEQLAITHLYLDQYEDAEKAAKKALTQMPDLLSARWIYGIAMIKSGRYGEGFKQCKTAAKKRAIPSEVNKILEEKKYLQEEWFVDIQYRIPAQNKKKHPIAHKIQTRIVPFIISIIAIPVLFIFISVSFSVFTQSGISLKIFPGSPSLTLLYADALYNGYRSNNAEADQAAFLSAIDQYAEAIRIDPQYALAYIRLGQAYASQGARDIALNNYNEAIRHYPAYAYAYLVRGNYNYEKRYESKSALENALADYRRAIQINPEYVEAYIGRGDANEFIGEKGAAVVDYYRAIKINPDVQCWTTLCWSVSIHLDSDNARAYWGRGDIYSNLAQYESAIADYTEAIHLDPKDGYPYFQRGDAFYNLSNFEAAAVNYADAFSVGEDNIYNCQILINNYNFVCLSAFIQANPDHADAYMYRGDTYNQMGKLENAIADYTQALQLNTQFAKQAYITRSGIYYLLGEYEKAIADYTGIINLDPDQASQYYIYRGDAYSLIGENGRAIADYRESIHADPLAAYLCSNIQCWSAVIEVNPNDSANYVMRARTYTDLGEFDMALIDYTTAIKLDAKNGDSYIGRGYVYAELSERRNAIADFSEAILLNPKSDLAYNNRGYTYYELGENEKAVADYIEAIRINPAGIEWMCDNIPCWDAATQLYPDDSKIFSGRGKAYFQLGQFEKAVSDYKKAIQLSPEKLDQMCDTISCWDAAIQIYPDNAEIYIKQGGAYYFAENYESAVSSYSQALLINPQSFGVYYQRGDAYFKIGDTESALADYTKAIINLPITCTTALCWTAAIQVDPNNVSSYIGRGNVYVSLGELKKAVADYTEALRIDPENPVTYSTAHVGLGNYFRALGEDEKAIFHYTKVIERGTVWNGPPCIARKDMQPYIFRGDLYRKLGKENEAIADYKSVINYYTEQIDCTFKNIALTRHYHQYNYSYWAKIDSQEDVYIATSLATRGSIYIKTGEIDKAIVDYSEAIGYFVHSNRYGFESAMSDPGLSYFSRGKAYYQLGKYENAIDDYTKAIKIMPNYADIYNKRGLAYQAIGKSTEAEADFQKYKELREQQ